MKLTEEAIRNHVPYIIVFSGNKCKISYEEGFENCLTVYSDLLKKMRGSGVKLLFEMLNGYDHQDYQADSEKFGFDLAKQLNDPDFKLLYDIYHMRKSGCDPFKNLDKKLPYIGHFHVADLDGRTFPREKGGIDYKAFLKAIPDEAYDGYVGMEFLTESPETELDLAAVLFRSYVK